jgi:hypothetical protein
LGIDSVIHEDPFEVFARQADASRDVITFGLLKHLTKQPLLAVASK